VQSELYRWRGVGLRRVAALLPFAAACLGLVAAAAAQTSETPTAAAQTSETPSDDAQVARRRPARARAPVGHADMVRRWHVPPADGPGLTPEGRPLLVLEVLHNEERIELPPLRDNGGFSPEDLERASHALRDRANNECEIHPRLLDLIYNVELHFQAKAIRVVSAYRRGRSKHSKGRAVDIVVPGVRDTELARFARTLGFIGVGLYPRSGFVHIDTRPQSYFWVDSSGPGQKGKAVQILAKAAAEADARALERGETPPVINSEGDTNGAAEDAEGTNGRAR
jgi:uncharacterized protein YcbK (DUF882 family)